MTLEEAINIVYGVLNVKRLVVGKDVSQEDVQKMIDGVVVAHTDESAAKAIDEVLRPPETEGRFV